MLKLVYDNEDEVEWENGEYDYVHSHMGSDA